MNRKKLPKLDLGEEVWCRIGILAVGYWKKNSLISEESLGYQNPTGREKGEDED